MQNYVVETDLETLDSIAFRFYGFSFGALEAIIEANPNIVWQESFIKQGTTIVLPEIEQEENVRIKLF